MKKILLATLTVACASGVQAQDPLSADAKFWYNGIKSYVMRAAEKMPEENYSFKPAPTVRAFGEIIGHIADEQYFFCGTVKGESTYRPTLNIRAESPERATGERKLSN